MHASFQNGMTFFILWNAHKAFYGSIFSTLWGKLILQSFLKVLPILLKSHLSIHIPTYQLEDKLHHIEVNFIKQSLNYKNKKNSVGERYFKKKSYNIVLLLKKVTYCVICNGK